MSEYTVEGYSGSYEPGESIADRLAGAVLMYWNEYLDVHGLQNPQMTPGLSEKSREGNRLLTELGTSLRRAVQTLSFDAEVMSATRAVHELIVSDVESYGDYMDLEDATVEGIAKALSGWPVVRDGLRVALGFEAAEALLSSAESRITELIQHMTSRELSECARAYLDRTVRMYLWGFDPECVVMCRSVLQAALEDALEDQLAPDRPVPGLEELIKLAGEGQLLPGFRRVPRGKGWEAGKGTPLWRANRIRMTANELVHDLPVLGAEDGRIAEASVAVKDLSMILSLLFPA